MKFCKRTDMQTHLCVVNVLAKGLQLVVRIVKLHEVGLEDHLNLVHLAVRVGGVCVCRDLAAVSQLVLATSGLALEDWLFHAQGLALE